jgi:hypothetical protein
MIGLRPFVSNDFGLLLDLANQAVPFSPRENADWFAARKAFDESRMLRRHYIAYQVNDQAAVGYGCLEQQGETAESLRTYVVCRPDRLTGTVGETLFSQLLADATALSTDGAVGTTPDWLSSIIADITDHTEHNA